MTITHHIIESKFADRSIRDFAVGTSQADLISDQEDEILALHNAAKLQPKCILLSYDVKKLETNDFIRFLLAESPESQIIVIGNYLSDEAILNCLLAGANGYMDYHEMAEYLEKAVRVVINGEAWISRKMAAQLISKLRN
jgi:DNA-binding NarL/FixJ family response regulator